ncbi:MAG TPA: hypothetical protein VF171_03570 [Trueperaceae bacterium]
MSEESQRTYTAREIVLELFPATHERLIPRPEAYRLEHRPGGCLALRELPTGRELLLTPVTPAGNPTTQLCCDLCRRNAPRHYLQMFRLALPNSDGRRFRYLSLCADAAGCQARRMGDDGLRALMNQVFGS